MASLIVTNTFVAGTTILSAAVNTNFDDIETYINNRNSGAAAWERVLATNASSVPGVFNNGAGTNDSLNAQDNGTNVFRVTDAGNIVPGSAALATTATDGFTYIETCAGTPTGVPTSFTGRVATIYDTTNNIFYVYDGGWQNTANNPGVDNSTIELNANLLRIKDGLTIQTLNIGTALQYKTFASLHILQIVQGTQNTTANYNSATFVDTGITVSITPKINTSKIFVIACFTTTQGAGDTGMFTLARAGTNLGGSGGLQRLPASNEDAMTLQFYDSPATTSATVYSVQYRNTAAAGSNNVPAATNTTAVIMAIEVAQ